MEITKELQELKVKLYRIENRVLLRSIEKDNGNQLIPTMFEAFKKLSGEDYIVWVDLLTGYKYDLTIAELVRIFNKEIMNINDFTTPSIKRIYEEMYNPEDMSKLSNYDFTKDILAIHLPSSHYDYLLS